jgi:hypothetical protein
MRTAEWTECITIYSKLSDQKYRSVLILRPKLLEHFNDRSQIEDVPANVELVKQYIRLGLSKTEQTYLAVVKEYENKHMKNNTPLQEARKQVKNLTTKVNRIFKDLMNDVYGTPLPEVNVDIDMDMFTKLINDINLSTEKSSSERKKNNPTGLKKSITPKDDPVSKKLDFNQDEEEVKRNTLFTA